MSLKHTLCFFVIAWLCECQPKEKEINLFIWSEYIPEKILRDFEREKGIRLQVAYYTSNEEMLAKILSGTLEFDIAVPSDYFLPVLLAEDLLHEIDRQNFPNWENLDPAFLGTPFDPENRYSVPYMAGHGVLVYDKKKTKPLKSYRDLWRSDLKNNLVILDDMRAVIGMVSRSLGYSWNERNPEKLKKVAQALIELKPNIKKFDSDSPKKILIDGEAVAGFVWGAEAFLAMKERPSLVAVLPEEGIYLWLDSFVLLKEAPHLENALEFIDYVLRPQVALEIALTYPYLTANLKARQLLPREIVKNPAIYPPQEVIAKGEYLLELGDVLPLYDQIWTQVKR